MKIDRSSGILLHITSLPGGFGIGDLGPEAYDFLDFLKKSGHSWWQLLPLTPTDGIYSHSPYSSHSAFAGNTLLISPELLEQEGYIRLENFPKPKGISSKKVIFEAVEEYKNRIFNAAFETFQKKNIAGLEYQEFASRHAFWLDNYCLYLALREKFENANWVDWPEKLRDRDPIAIKQAEKDLEEKIAKEKFIQFLFFSQWEKLSEAAHEQGIKLFGDIPFYINHDSADCWANPEYFKLDEEKQPTHVSGVPPDLFSKSGQLWGTPVFDWKELKNHHFDWWITRLRQNLLLFNVVRLDHFRAFSAYWEVPAGEKTAVHGTWTKTPGTEFFKLLQKEFPEMPFVAEDLGSLDQPVYDLLEKFNFPCMKVLQFAFGDENPENPYLPYNHTRNSVVYTGTHDNNTTLGWFRNTGKTEKQHLREYVGRSVSARNVHKVFHRLSLQSVADLSITPLQDLAGLGEEALMNVPGSTEGNWTWRIASEEMPQNTEELRHLNQLFGRGD